MSITNSSLFEEYDKVLLVMKKYNADMKNVSKELLDYHKIEELVDNTVKKLCDIDKNRYEGLMPEKISGKVKDYKTTSKQLQILSDDLDKLKEIRLCVFIANLLYDKFLNNDELFKLLNINKSSTEDSQAFVSLLMSDTGFTNEHKTALITFINNNIKQACKIGNENIYEYLINDVKIDPLIDIIIYPSIQYISSQIGDAKKGTTSGKAVFSICIKYIIDLLTGVQGFNYKGSDIINSMFQKVNNKINIVGNIDLWRILAIKSMCVYKPMLADFGIDGSDVECLSKLRGYLNGVNTIQKVFTISKDGTNEVNGISKSILMKRKESYAGMMSGNMSISKRGDDYIVSDILNDNTKIVIDLKNQEKIIPTKAVEKNLDIKSKSIDSIPPDPKKERTPEEIEASNEYSKASKAMRKYNKEYDEWANNNTTYNAAVRSIESWDRFNNEFIELLKTNSNTKSKNKTARPSEPINANNGQPAPERPEWAYKLTNPGSQK